MSMKFLPAYLEERAWKIKGCISIVENSSVLTKQEAITIAQYMSSCIPLEQYMGSKADPLNKSSFITETTWTDGAYIWEESHIYFIIEYRVRLPRNFRLHVKKQIVKGFDSSLYDWDEIKKRYDEIVELIIQGDESFYDLSYFLPKYFESKNSRVTIDGSFYSESVKQKYHRKR